eukprot:TRINITY_DN10010_c0_g1_i2.p1 TRINITY_DN10010_c0_g1~~TRINITY_DN10010_c0_g1_i2.p1  ORF type:complete len:325 (+),score=72.79 TRINITY_DN10010_c0_g1_i2:55-1029(+)
MDTDDIAVQGTNNSAVESKWNATQLGYWRDPYIGYFLKSRKSAQNAPIMNRGYYARVSAISHIMKKFIKTFGKNVQIISLGAGSDTSFFQLSDQDLCPKAYVELDFYNVALSKVMTIRKTKPLLDKMGDAWTTCKTKEKGELHCGHYHLVPVDLRDLSSIQNALLVSNIQKDIPTLILSECVLIYLAPEDSAKVIQWTADYFDSAIFLTYEQIGLPTAFTRTMNQNFGSMGCPLLGISAVPSLSSQEDRYRQHGWMHSFALDMIQVYGNLSREENARIEKIEWFDEYEEWRMMLSHYCLVCSVVNKTSNELLATFQQPSSVFAP